MRAIALALLVTTACTDTTGGHTVSYDVAARGLGLPGNAVPAAAGWQVVLTKAVVHIGAVYLNLAVSNPEVAAGTSCILPGIYTGEELSGLDVDVLSTTPQPFATPGVGTDDESRTGEVWLTGGDVNATADPTIIADLAGTATNTTTTLPFTASVTIGANRLIKSSDPANPSAHPICKQRIVSPIQIDFRPAQGGTLLVTIDPTLWFANVDFTPLVSSPPAAFVFPDDDSLPASQNLFTGLRSSGGTFNLTFE
jgi:hypothetical protein